jgi:hypothetical protein
MATLKPRVNVPFDPASYAELKALAEGEGCSLSEQVRSMVLEMLELIEDRALASAAAARRPTLRKGLSHGRIWGRSPRKRQ